MRPTEWRSTESADRVAFSQNPPELAGSPGSPRGRSEPMHTAAVAPPEYWDALYRDHPLTYTPDDVLFRELFPKHLTPGGTCFEVGCFPGKFLIYLGQTFGYRVGGIDTTPRVADLPAFVRSHGVEVTEFVRGDFLTHRTDRQYDVVCSFGFIEHFVNYREVIRRHADLVRPGGSLVLSCPNFRRGQALFHRVFAATSLKRHVLPAMDFREWRAALDWTGMAVEYEGYYRTCELWGEADGVVRPVRDTIGRYLSRFSYRLDRRVRLPNRWTSPYMIMFARKPA